MKFLLIAILYALESLLQRHTRKPLFPCALLLCSIALSVCMNDISGGIPLYDAILQGVLYVGAAVYLHDVLLVLK